MGHEDDAPTSSLDPAPLTTEIEDLARALHDRLSGGGRSTVATAESCTGGGVAAAITAISGSSEYFLGGIVAYHNDVKMRLLGVPAAVLEEHGAVSEACAQAMALGARRIIGSELAVSTTGIAGPTGATPTKPVGLVYTAVASAAGVRVAEHRFAGDRRAIVLQSIRAALRQVLDTIETTTTGTGSPR